MMRCYFLKVNPPRVKINSNPALACLAPENLNDHEKENILAMSRSLHGFKDIKDIKDVNKALLRHAEFEVSLEYRVSQINDWIKALLCTETDNRISVIQTEICSAAKVVQSKLEEDPVTSKHSKKADRSRVS